MTARRIESWEAEKSEKFIEFLVRQVLRPHHPRYVLEQEQWPFQKIKALAAERDRQQAEQAGQESAALYQKAISAKDKQISDALELAAGMEAEREQAIKEADQLKSHNWALQNRLDTLQAQLNSPNHATESLPDSLGEIEAWAKQNLGDAVVLHERAIKTASQSAFEDVDLVYKALLMLRDYYAPMHREGDNKKHAAYQQRLSELHLKDTPCFSQENKAKSKKYKGQYHVDHNGRECELDQHLKGSDSRMGVMASGCTTSGTMRPSVWLLEICCTTLEPMTARNRIAGAGFLALSSWQGEVIGWRFSCDTSSNRSGR